MIGWCKAIDEDIFHKFSLNLTFIDMYLSVSVPTEDSHLLPMLGEHITVCVMKGYKCSHIHLPCPMVFDELLRCCAFIFSRPIKLQLCKHIPTIATWCLCARFHLLMILIPNSPWWWSLFCQGHSVACWFHQLGLSMTCVTLDFPHILSFNWPGLIELKYCSDFTPNSITLSIVSVWYICFFLPNHSAGQ